MITEKEIGAITAVLDDKRDIIVRALAGYIARPSHGTSTEEHDKVAGALFDATLATFAGATPPAGLSAKMERAWIIRFGDGLMPILKDTVGPDLPRSSFLRLGDAYWRMVNSSDLAAV